MLQALAQLLACDAEIGDEVLKRLSAGELEQQLQLLGGEADLLLNRQLVDDAERGRVAIERRRGRAALRLFDQHLQVERERLHVLWKRHRIDEGERAGRPFERVQDDVGRLPSPARLRPQNAVVLEEDARALAGGLEIQRAALAAPAQKCQELCGPEVPQAALKNDLHDREV
jgi:hypothetical protein